MKSKTIANDEIILKTPRELQICHWFLLNSGVLMALAQMIDDGFSWYTIKSGLIWVILGIAFEGPIFFQVMRTITMNATGVQVSFWNYKKIYSWDELKIRRIEKPDYSGEQYAYKKEFVEDFGEEIAYVLLAVRPVKRKKREGVRAYCTWKRPFDTVWLSLLPQEICDKGEENKESFVMGYRDFMDKMQEWGIAYDEILVTYNFNYYV